MKRFKIALEMNDQAYAGGQQDPSEMLPEQTAPAERAEQETTEVVATSAESVIRTPW